MLSHLTKPSGTGVCMSVSQMFHKLKQCNIMLAHLRQCELDLTVFQKHNDGIPVIPIFNGF